MNYQHILVGQGIAGSVLALALYKQGKNILVIDKPELSSCSRVAAGVWNPIVFKRLNKSWMADELLPAADSFYKWAEGVLSATFYYPMPMVKFFTEQQEIDLWNKKLRAEEGAYLSSTINAEYFPNFFHQGISSSEVLHSGFLNTQAFLVATRKFFREKKILIEEKFDYNAIQIDSNENYSYRNIKASQLIFCEGYKAFDNPYFPKQAFKLTKGETLRIRIENLAIDKIVNKGVFIVPLGNNIYKVGATYEWNTIDELPTDKGLLDLKLKLEKLLCVPFEVLEHSAGVRPTTTDRRPIIGQHIKHKNIFFFNGLGTKAVLIAPYWAEQTASDNLAGNPFFKECDVARFY